MPRIRTLRGPRRLSPVLALAGTAVLVAAHWAAGPARVAAQESTFEGVADVVEVQVPVNVFTRNGEPVRGLTVEDFEVLDRGTKQRITGFDVVDLEVLQPETLGGPEALEAAIPAAARRHFLLLFDLTFATPSSVTKARRAAREFVLQELHPTDLAAVATFSMDVGPQLLVTFTPDRAQLARAIQTLGAPRLLEQQGALDPLRFMIDDPERSSMSSTFTEGDLGPGQFAGMDQEVQAYLKVVAKQMGKWEKSYLRGRVSSWVASLEGMARALASVDGRKHVVFFSEGFDGRLMFGRGPDPQDEEAREDRRNLDFNRSFMVDSDDIYGNTALQQQVTGALQTFRRSDCVIQAVDISGLGSDSAEHRRAHAVGQDALFYMANETGGTLFEDTNDLGSELDEVLARSSVTYLLSFEPAELERDGTYHRLEIRLAGDRKARLSHREGYFAPRPFEELHQLEKSLLASDAIASAAPRRDLDLNVLAAPFRANEDSAYIPVIIEVHGDKLLVDQDEDDALSAEFYTYVSDAEGRMRDFFSQMVTLNLTGEGREAMRSTGVKYYGHLSLEPGEYLVRVLVRNATTGRTGVESIPVSVPDYESADLQVLPPFFIEPPGREWFMVREQREGQGSTVVYPFTVNGSPYVPAARPVLEPGEEKELVLVAYNLADGAVELDGKILTPDGRELDAGRLSLVERTVTGIGGVDKLLARFRVNELESGTYTLQVALEHPDTGVARVNSIPFRVKFPGS